jgi:hypothetical protein
VARGDTTTAEHHFRTGLGVCERLAAADPGNAQYRFDVTYVRQRLASLTDPDAAG